MHADIILPQNNSPAKPLSKSAKKNAARRAKKASEGNEGSNVTQSVQQSAKGQHNQPAVDGSNGGANEPENEQEAKEKKIRALKKKLRQCEQLEEKRSGGAELTPEQEDKLAGMKELCASTHHHNVLQCSSTLVFWSCAKRHKAYELKTSLILLMLWRGLGLPVCLVVRL